MDEFENEDGPPDEDSFDGFLIAMGLAQEDDVN